MIKEQKEHIKIYFCDACCCGDPRFAQTRAPLKQLLDSFVDRLKLSGTLLLCDIYTTGCMGPCSVGNNVVVKKGAKKFAFNKMNHLENMVALGDFVDGWAQGNPTDPSGDLASHVMSFKQS